MERLKLYRRHLAGCEHIDKGRRFDRCKCPVWIQGTWDGKAIRKSLDVDSWAKAEKIKNQIEHGKETQKQETTVEAALDAFVSDCESRNLAERTRRKYHLFRKCFLSFMVERQREGIAEIDAGLLRDFRASRKLGPRTNAKELERIRAFFRFCVSQGYIEKSPAAGIRPPKVNTLPRLPFNENETQKILDGTKNDRELAFILVLRHTGLRIGDASLLRTSQVDGERIHLYTTKAGTPVSIKIPPTLTNLLNALPTTGGHFFLWGESTHVHSVSNLWRRRIVAICEEAGISPPHPHRFRHSLAADLLMKGASVEDVAAILGNSPGVVVRHYSQWIKGRQDRLDAFMESTWEKPKLKLVK